MCLSAPAPGQYAGVCGLLLSFANIGMLPLYGAPRFRGGSTGQCMLCGYTVPLSSLHVLAWLPFLNSGLGLPCIVIMVSPWVSALSCHSSLFGTCIPAALVCIPCMLVPVPLATTGRTLHALEPGLGEGGRLAVWCFACAALPGSRLACMFVLQELFRRGWPRFLGSGFQCFASDLCQFLFVGCAPSRA